MINSKMKQKTFFLLENILVLRVLPLGLILLSLSCGNLRSEEAPGDKGQDERPNIVLILADDLGFSDLGCYGGEINTPNLDRLANGGLRFNSFYNTSRCCPSRASLLTGLYPHQAGIGRMTRDQHLPGYQGILDSATVTIAEVLGEAGYNTGMVGKWHVSPTNALEKEDQLAWLSHQKDFGDFSDTSTYPTSRGFDRYYGNIWGVVDYFDPFSLVNGKEPVKEVPDDFYYTDAIGDSAVAYVEDFSKSANPFFLYVAHCAPHWPLQAPEEEIAKYKDVYKEGWREIRKARYKRLIDKGILQGDVAQLSEFMFPEKNWENNPDKKWDARAMAVHAAMVDRLDQNIGNLIDKLEETGELDNTVIFFMSDNGASSERPSKYGPGFDRAGSTRDGRDVVFPVEKDSLPGSQTVVAGIGPVWANVANAPFRYWKARAYEGGITSPLIVHWPKGAKGKGVVKTEAAHIVDMMNTCIDIAGADYPNTFNGRKITPTRGNSILPIIKGESHENSQEIYFWEHFGSAAIREGDWKLVQLNPKTKWELFNLAEDRTETNDLSEEYPEKLQEMKTKWEELANELDVFPSPTPIR